MRRVTPVRVCRVAAGLLLVGVLLAGCQTVRSATYPDHSYDDVFRAAVAGLCGQKGAVLYEADKERGVLNLQTTGFFTGGATIRVTITNTDVPLMTIVAPGMNNPWGDRTVNAIQQNLGARGKVKRAAPVAARPAPRAAGAHVRNIAVASLDAQNVSAGDAAVIADLLRNELVKTGAFSVIEKSNMDRVLAEQAFQQTGCTSQECAVRLGKLLNVKRIIVGSFGKLMGRFFVNIRVVDVETGEVVFSDGAKGEDVDAIETGIKNLAASVAATEGGAGDEGAAAPAPAAVATPPPAAKPKRARAGAGESMQSGADKEAVSGDRGAPASGADAPAPPPKPKESSKSLF